MNYKQKWQDNLLKRLRAEGVVNVETRDSRVIGYLTELQEAGKIATELTAGGVWTCKLKDTAPVKTGP